VEVQLDAMHSPVVQLKSGGYIVINQTEALVAIDVNSGRATKERHIEETALKTNLEASDEVARQLRLRDLAGLIVIDFIDMEEGRNNHAVERRLKEALKNDRARIQVGKISAFGLLELSRQRLRPSLQETAFAPCPQCAGTGLVRSVESAAVHILRAVEEEGIRHRSSEVTMTVASIIALYILNQKRDALRAIEERYDFRVLLLGDDTLIPPAFRMDRVRADSRSDEVVARTAISMDDNLASRIVEEEAEAAIEEEEAEDEEDSVAEAAEAAEIAEGRADPGAVPGESEQDAANRRRRRRRRRKRKGDGIAVGGEGEGEGEGVASESAAGDGGEAGDDEAERDEHEQGDHEEGDLDQDEGEEGEDGEERAAGEEGEGDQPRNKRRRGRRGGRRRRRREEGGPESGEEAGEEVAAVSGEDSGEAVAEVAGDAEDGAGDADSTVTDEDAEAVEATPTEEKPKRKRAPRKKPVVEAAPTEGEVAEAAPTEEKPKRKRAPSRKKAVAAEAGPVEEAAEPAPVDSTEDVADESVEVAPEQQAEGEAVQAEQAETVTEPGESVQAENSPADEPAREEARSDEGGRAEEGAQPEQEGGGFVPPSEDPAAPSAEEEAPLPAGPPRRGWWNRLMS
jgi:ribonuclease E